MVAKTYSYDKKTDPGRKFYYVKWKTLDGKQHTKRGFQRKRDADDYAAHINVSISNGDYIDPQSGNITVASLYGTYITGKEGVNKKSYVRDLKSAWETHVQHKWGSRRISSIRRSEIQTWVSRLSAGDEVNKIPPKSASVTIRAYGVLNGILKLAVSDRLIHGNPCEGVNLPKKMPKKRTYLDAQQVMLLADASGDYRPLILLLGFCGLRMGEARGLTVEDIHADDHRISVTRSITRVNREWVINEPKTWERREVPVPDYVMSQLVEHCKGKAATDRVFTSRSRGGYLGEYQRGTSDWYSTAITKSGVPSLAMHDLRHTAASIAVSAGANVKAIQRMLGHKTAAMTLDTYADLFDSDLDAVAVRVNDQIVSREKNMRKIQS